jgi:hypothetical protein
MIKLYLLTNQLKLEVAMAKQKELNKKWLRKDKKAHDELELNPEDLKRVNGGCRGPDDQGSEELAQGNSGDFNLIGGPSGVFKKK